MSRLVAALRTGYATSAVSVVLAGGVLAQGTDLSGRVLDLSTGQPVAGARHGYPVNMIRLSEHREGRG